MTMLRKLTFVVLAAASLSAVALAPTAASARHFGGGGGGNFHRDHFDHFNHFGHFGHHYGIGYVGGGGYDNGCFVTRPVLTRLGYRIRTVNICGY
jgi:uncharacterized membrane protein